MIELASPIKKYLVWIKEIETIRDGDFHVVLCHYPIAHWKKSEVWVYTPTWTHS